MNLRTTENKDILFCRKLFTALQWAQAIFGAFMLFIALAPALHAALAGVVGTVLLLSKHSWDIPLVRGAVRVLCGVPFLLVVLFLVEGIQLLTKNISLQPLLLYMCLFGGMAMSYFTLAAGTLSLKGGRYDKIVACSYYTWQTAITILIAFAPVCDQLLLSWDHLAARILWIILTVSATVLCWLCAFLPTPRT